MIDSDTVDAVKAAAARALNLVCITQPHLVGLAHAVQIQPDLRVGTAGVFASGRLLVDPSWFLALNERERAFVVAHELLHLALRTHQRAGPYSGGEFNAAHDLIINDMLEHETGMPPPGGGLRQPGARHSSAEALVAQHRLNHTDPFRPPVDTAVGAAMRAALQRRGDAAASDSAVHAGSDLPFDVLPDDLERTWFPEQSRAKQATAASVVERAATRAIALQRVQERAATSAREVHEILEGSSVVGSDSDDPETTYVEALATAYRPTWELAMHRWIDAVSSSQRTYTRASRRGADRTDVVLPGRSRDAWTLSIVLDTSGSMTDEIAAALGAIASFGRGAGIEEVRILQCDTEVTADDIVGIDELDQFAVTGFGGSDMTAALHHLADDPSITAVVVITDGYIDYPEEQPPFDVLWAVTESDYWWAEQDWFTPPYGQVLRLPRNPKTDESL